ncbi:MAG: hypothetical protein JSV83_17685, partial [Desulfobacterales bacterium]
QIASEKEGSIVKPVFAVSSCEELILPIPFPPLLIDLCTQIMAITAIGRVRNNHLFCLILFRLTLELTAEALCPPPLISKMERKIWVKRVFGKQAGQLKNSVSSVRDKGFI